MNERKWAWPDTPIAQQNLDALSGLAQAIGMAAPGRFVLLLVKCNLPVQRETLTEQLRAMLEPLDVVLAEVSLDGPVDDLLNYLKNYLESAGRQPEPVLPPVFAVEQPTVTLAEPQASYSVHPGLALSVHGLAASLRSDDPDPPILTHLNLARERYRKLLGCPLLLWLPDYALTRLAQEAPDFWAWRSGVFEFVPEPEIAESALRRMAYEPDLATSNLDAAAKRERLALLERLLADYVELGETQDTQADILFKMGNLRHDLGDYDEARRLYHNSLDIARQLGNRAGISSTLHQLGMLAQVQGDYDEARRLYHDSLDIARQLGDRAGVAQTLHQLGTLAQVQGDYDEVRRLYHDSLDIKQQLGNRASIATTAWNLGNVAYLQGDLNTAKSHYQDALAVFKELGDRKNEAGVLHQLGMLAQVQGDYDEARRLYHDSLDIARQLGNRTGTAISQAQLALLEEAEGNIPRALELIRQAETIFTELRSPMAVQARRGRKRLEGKQSRSL